MTSPQSLPRKPSSTQAPSFPALSDLQDAIKFTPAFEVKTFNVLAGDYPINMSTKLPGFYGVAVVGAWQVTDGAPVVAGCVAWRRGVNEGDVQITNIGGLTTGTKYLLTMELRGMR